MNTVQLQGLGQQSQHTMIPLMEFQLAISALLAGVYNIRPPQPRYTFIWDVKKVIDFLATLNSSRELKLEDLTLKLTMLLALTSAARASEIGFLDILYLIKHSPGYTFHFGKNTKISKRSKPRDPVEFHIFRENQSLHVDVDVLIYTLKGQRKNEDKIHSSC